jgi:hypothetical protein
LNDEGSSALHYLDLDQKSKSWSFAGPGRDLQLIGADRVLRSTPRGFVELGLAGGGLLREVELEAISGVESARRLANGHTIVLGNHPEGIVLCELDERARPLPGRQLLGAGLEKGRMVRPTLEGKLLFCSETAGRRMVHEADFDAGVSTLFEIPADVPADSMVKAVRLGSDRIVVSSGYAASLLLIDTARGLVVQTIGGRQQDAPAGLHRPLSPHFFSGYQILQGGDYLLANWQGHGPSHAGEGYQLLLYGTDGRLKWCFDQTEYPQLTSLNNVIALDNLDTSLLHEEWQGPLAPLA